MSAPKLQRVGIAMVAAAIVALAGCQPPPPPPPDYAAEMGPAVEAFIDAWNSGNVDVLDPFISPDFKRRTPRGTSDADGLEGLKDVIRAFHTAYPDLGLKMTEAHFAKDLAYIHWTATGTNTGEGEFPPTGKTMNVSGLTLARFSDGKITDEIVFYDTLDHMQQLGFKLMPPQAPKPAKK